MSRGEGARKAIAAGTHRVVHPAVTLERIRPYLPAMGITRIGLVTGLDRIGLPVAMAFRPNSRSLSVSQGKGLTTDQAMASAAMEAVELFHGEALIDRCRYARSPELERAVPLAALPRTAKRLGKATRLPWIHGIDIVADQPCWVPYELVHTDFTLPQAEGSGYFLTSTSGLASGNHRAEALCAALCELIERDAESLWEARGGYARGDCRLDLASVDDTDCIAVMRMLQAAGVRLRAWDITSDIGVAAFLCCIRAGEQDACPGTYQGSGCHPDRGTALLRALTEAIQSRLTRIVGARDDLIADDYRVSAVEAAWDALIDIQSSGRRARRFAAVPGFATDDIADDIAFVLQRLAAIGLTQVILVDLTRPDFAIPVLRVVIPGLEGPHAHPLYRPGKRARAAARG